MFLKYPHLERFGNEAVEGIEQGITYVFPKLDGTNAQVWQDEDGNIRAGSRNRSLTLENDNAGFYNWVVNQPKLREALRDYPHLQLYGEWLVPHSLKTYREDAWRKFYIFDIWSKEDQEFIHYDGMSEFCAMFDLDYLPPIRIIKNGNREHYEKCLEENKFLIKDGMGIGEGIVIKNYGWQNKFNKVTWAKIITNGFKELHHKEMGAPILGGETIEEKMVDELVTQHFVDKVVSKIVVEKALNENVYGSISKSDIPRLLQTVFYDLVTEETWDFIKKNKNPRIDFAFLQRLTIAKVKQTRRDIF